MHRRMYLGACALWVLLGGSADAGPFPPAAGQPGSNAVPFDSPAIKGWASEVVSLTRGPRNIANPGLGLASFGTGSNALGPAGTDTTAVVSLGDGGSIMLRFATPIRNGAGDDLAVFENGFADGFIELAFVEVSSNGTDFFRFASQSLTDSTQQVGSFGSLDPTNIQGLAGQFRVGFGSPFDLEEFVGRSPLLDVNAISFVRIVDVVGSIDPLYGTYDSQGRIINDPYPTSFASGGFDLDGVAALHVVPEAKSWMLFAVAVVAWVCARQATRA